LREGEYDGEVLLNGPAVLPIRNSRAAGWFLPNVIHSWKSNPFVAETVPPARRTEIAGELERIRSAGGDRRDITWTMRRLVLRRR
jgi:hypothetical protein